MTDSDKRVPLRTEGPDDESTTNPLSRRQALKRGAVVTAAVAWTVPVVQLVTMTPSHAESASAPPVTRPRQPPHEHPKPTPEPKPTHHPKQTEQPAPKTPSRKSAQPTPDGATPASFRHTALPSPAGSVVEVAGSVPGTPDALAVTGSALPVDKGIAAGAGLLIAGSAAAFLGRRKGAEPATVEADQAPGDSD